MHNKVKVLVVEDERIVAEDIKSSLKNIGYSVTGTVSTGAMAVKHVQKEPPNLILMDIVIQGKMNGIQTAEKIRSDFDIPIVYLTAYADQEILEKAKITEPFGYIIKPFNDRELLSTIEMALYKHHMEKKLKESEVWFSTTLMSIGDGLIATNRSGQVMFMNSVAEKLTGWKQEEAVGRSLKDVFSIVLENKGKPVPNPVEMVIRTGKIFKLSDQTILITKNGKKMPIDDNAAPIKDQRGDVIGTVLVFRDITKRKQAEEALQESEEMYRRLVETTPEAVTVTDLNGKITYVSQRTLDLHGLKNSSDLLGRSAFELIDKEEHKKAKRNLLRTLDGEIVRNIEYNLIREDNTSFIGELSSALIRDAHGKPKQFIATTRDITNRKQAEEALQMSEKRYRGLFETMNQGVIYFGVNNKIISCNPAAEQIMGMRMYEMIGRLPTDLCWHTIKENGLRLSPEEHPVLQAFRTGKSVSDVVLGILTPNKERKWLLLSATPVFYGQLHQPSSVFTTFTDVTHRKKMEIDLQKRNEQLRSLNILAHSVSGTLELKQIAETALKEVIRMQEFSGGILFLFNENRSDVELKLDEGVSEKVINLLENLHIEKSYYRTSLMRGKTRRWLLDDLFYKNKITDHVDNHTTGKIYCLVVPIKTGKRVVGSLNLFGPHKLMPAEIDFDFFSSVGGHIGLAVTNARLYEKTNHALTELEITQDKLIQSEKLAGLGALASNVVHEIGNPLAAITNSVQVLQNRVHLEGRMKELMDIVGWETERLNRTIDQLREFSRPKELVIEKSDLREIVTKVILFLKQDVELVSGRQIVTHFSNNLPLAYIDRDAMEQVVLNLVKNALQAIEKTGVVEIWLQSRSRESKKQIRFQVKDDGVGISKDNLSRIFEPYFSTKAKGMGLGMHIVKQIVETHGGRIRVKSTEKQGTNVIIDIPVMGGDYA
ncbi:PAS domain S-box protein [bacterium]|nr:PAS domain S-box protein [bacterium]RQV99162.1 MAG: PAS domain S-box protein [bacterium]